MIVDADVPAEADVVTVITRTNQSRHMLLADPIGCSMIAPFILRSSKDERKALFRSRTGSVKNRHLSVESFTKDMRHRIAAEGAQRGTEAAGPFHRRITDDKAFFRFSPRSVVVATALNHRRKLSPQSLDVMS